MSIPVIEFQRRRKVLGLTQRGLAMRLGIAKRAMEEIEARSKTEVPTRYVLALRGIEYEMGLGRRMDVISEFCYAAAIGEMASLGIERREIGRLLGLHVLDLSALARRHDIVLPRRGPRPLKLRTREITPRMMGRR